MPRSRMHAAGIALYGLLWGVVSSVAAGPAMPQVRILHRGVTTLPQSVADRNGEDVPITGLSGITWLGDDRYAAIMDNSDKLLLFTLPISPDGQPGEPRDLELVTLAERHDYEDVAICPPPLRERIVARQLRRGLPDPGRCLLVAEEDTPAIRAVSLVDGSLLGVIPIPEKFATRRPNRGLESLDIDPDGRHVWTANEEPLPDDGPSVAEDGTAVVRLARITIPEPGEQHHDQPIQLAYAVDPPHNFSRVFSGAALSGVAALVGLNEGLLIVLERSGCPGLPPFENRIYLVDTSNAVNVTPLEGDLGGRPETCVPKQLIWKDQLGCNIEGLCLGPTLLGTRRALIAVADNNGIGTPNHVISLVLEEESSSVPLPLIASGSLIVALAGLVLLKRRFA